MRKLFTLFFILISLQVISSAFDFDSFDYKSMTANPYRVLGVAPWSSMKTMKSKYKKLVKKYHPDKQGGSAEKFRLIQKSYEDIKKQRKEATGEDVNEESEEEVTLFSIGKKTVGEIFQLQIVFLIIYYLSNFWYKLHQYLLKPIFIFISIYAMIDRVIPHYFESGFQEFEWVCILSGVIIFQKKLLSLLWNKIIDKK